MINIGDRVVCVDAKDHKWDGHCHSGLKEGREYIVYGEFLHCKRSLDVGIVSPINETQCSSCLALSKGSPWYAAEYRFRKIEEKINYVKLEVEIPEEVLEEIQLHPK